MSLGTAPVLVGDGACQELRLPVAHWPSVAVAFRRGFYKTGLANGLENKGNCGKTWWIVENRRKSWRKWFSIYRTPSDSWACAVVDVHCCWHGYWLRVCHEESIVGNWGQNSVNKHLFEYIPNVFAENSFEWLANVYVRKDHAWMLVRCSELAWWI